MEYKNLEWIIGMIFQISLKLKVQDNVKCIILHSTIVQK